MPHFPDPVASTTPFLVKVKFDSVVLVCGDCEKRSSGPTHLTAREVRKDLKHRLAESPRSFRIVPSPCFGLCPKKALAVVALPAATPLLAAEVKSASDVARFASLILQAPDATGNAP